MGHAARYGELPTQTGVLDEGKQCTADECVLSMGRLPLAVNSGPPQWAACLKNPVMPGW